MSENGQVYNLTNAIRTKIDQQIKKIIYVNGYRIYNESYKVVQTHYHHYKRVIELVRDKVVISCDVHFDEMEGYHELSDIYAYYPDGRIIQYRNLTTTADIEIHGKIKKIYDASMNNCLTFAYETGGDNKGQIDTITDSTGRILHFTYDNNDIILSLETDTHTTYNLIRYRVRNNRLLEIKHLEHGSDENSVVETLYDYTIDSESWNITITYPSGGTSSYTFKDTYCAKGDRNQKPMVYQHFVNEGSYAPESAIQVTTFSYYNGEDENLAKTNPYDNVNVKKTTTVLSDAHPLYQGNKQQMNQTFYTYNTDDSLKGEYEHILYIRENDKWVFHKADTNSFVEIIPEYYELKEQAHYFNRDDYLQCDYKYCISYKYDWYGQVVKETKVDSDDTVLKETYTDYVYSYAGDSPAENGEEKIPFDVKLDNWNQVDKNITIALNSITLKPCSTRLNPDCTNFKVRV